jgi:hypothetical protein
MKPLPLALSLSWLLAAAHPALAATDPTVVRTLPTSILMVTAPVQTEDATYSFQVLLTEPRIVEGIPQLKLYTTITKTSGATQIVFQQIVVQVPQDASSVRLKADGEQFVLECSFRDPFDRTAEPRQVATTFGQMFNCGKVGITVRLSQ